ncbi:FG-GAP-like repeat-containing protein [Streptomyces cavernae]|uniref:FG-GAP-like repeat-containing protein n=1 Tax=Streptomyces cavernae TaxID=2259034 RepID=UPI000FEBF137|nr:FG-GAP-like repeat-containing protein [Streptomyces cavernae]
MHKYLRLALATATATALAGGGLLTFSAVTATAATVAPDDFNGDGYRDLAIGASNTDVGGRSAAGAVIVLYGSSSGVSAARRTVITQNSSGVAGTAEQGDLFGTSLSPADFNRDGYADLAVGAEGESIGDRDAVGMVTILWGSSSGLKGGVTVPQPSTLSEYGGYSMDLAAADFNGDGAADLTVTGQSRTRLYLGPFKSDGTAASAGNVGMIGSTADVAAGDLNGDGAAERVYPFRTDADPGGHVWYYRWTGSSYAITDMTKADGDKGAVGDINGDGYGDLVLSQHQDPDENYPVGHKGGQLAIWYGGPAGPDLAQTPTVIHQDTAGVPGAGETYDRFGATVSLGDINGDKFADVAVGAPGEDVGTKRDAGSVTVLYGSASGLTTTGAKTYTQDTSGVPGAAETYDGFGGAVRLIDLNKNGRAELVVSAPDENSRGAVWILGGTSAGVTTTGAKSISALDVSLTTASNFGTELAE